LTMGVENPKLLIIFVTINKSQRLLTVELLIYCTGALARVRWSSSVGPVLTADPTRALMDEQIRIRARHLPPLSPVTLWTQMYCEDGDLWQSYAHYNTDSDGSVNLCRDASVGGSYVGCEPMGLFWALQPAPGGREGLRLRKRDVQTPYVVNLSVSGGHVSPEDRGTQGSELASVSIERWYMAPGVKRMEIREHGLVGTLFIPPGPGPFPAVLDLWGSLGGLIEYRSALLASRGYASFFLAYYGPEMPGPLDTINVVGVIGLSYGVYLALRTATSPGVEVEKLPCPVLFIVGEDDLNCASAENADSETLKAAGKGHLLTRLSYPGAGHLIEPPYSPHSRISLWMFMVWGGRVAPHAAAQEDAWKKMLQFMNTHLRHKIERLQEQQSARQ
uniref:Uncharacterized protein n=1 Tax=Neogobius melanostomus TaxID=47308 RepID=A0A8C6UQ03_9GOBI